MKELNKQPDLQLPEWGPYTKKYMGISHISDQKKGLRFDLSVFPGFYRRKVYVPNVMWESDYHPWEASADLNYFSHRHEMEWKDKVYTDISFSKIDDHQRLIRCECINETELEQNVVLHYMAYMNFPTLKPYSQENIFPCKVSLPEGAFWVDALDYEELQFAIGRPSDNLVYEGWYRGEIRDNYLVNGSGLGDGFGKDFGDTVKYKISVQNPIKEGCILIRFRMENSTALTLSLKGFTEHKLCLTGTGDFAEVIVPVGDVKKGEHFLIIMAEGGTSIEIDGFAIASMDTASKIDFIREQWNPYPQTLSGPIANSLILKYADSDQYYGLLWQYEQFQIREFYCDELDRYFRHYVHEHVKKVFKGEGKNHYTNIFLRPIEIKPKSRRIIYAMVCNGSKAEVENYIQGYSNKIEDAENIFIANRNTRVSFSVSGEGEKYLFSQERMAATTLCNVVYPIYTKRQYIRHSTPGRWWDCLYTWDSGFIGLGLLELDAMRAAENLNAYLTGPEDTQTAFIHHGSIVPVQFYLFLEIWNRTHSREYLEYFYPRLRHYYEFFAGKAGSSTTRTLKSNLLKTWDYFYNSGGWDDYPPQMHVRNMALEKVAAPVITSSQCIRIAKIMKMAAEALGLNEDVAEYNEDISIISEAIQKYCWDEKSGYFGYVLHDEAGYPKEILRYQDNSNYNMGFDGIYPLVAGICTESQEDLFINYLSSKKHMWTDIGITAIDQSAPYYRNDGYWNGTVWLSHQWFFWKTMLDLGKWEFAFKIARTALEVWKCETDETYNCMEHFIINSGRGAGWHQFGGLSAPVMNWLGAYYVPGRLTAGFDVWIGFHEFTFDNTLLKACIKFYASSQKKCCIVATMNPDYKYDVFWNGKAVTYEETIKGSLQILISNESVQEGDLIVFKKNYKCDFYQKKIL